MMKPEKQGKGWEELFDSSPCPMHDPKERTTDLPPIVKKPWDQKEFEILAKAVRDAEQTIEEIDAVYFSDSISASHKAENGKSSLPLPEWILRDKLNEVIKHINTK